MKKSAEMKKIVKSAIGTKFINKWADLACDMAIKSVSTVSMENATTGRREIDIKRYAKVEKVWFVCINCFCPFRVVIFEPCFYQQNVF